MSEIEAQVVIVGGGPVGLTLAMWLADAGVEVVVLERRSAREAPPVKCNHISARSMEVFRRLDVADALRASGLPDEHAHDAAFRTTMIGEDFGRITIPGRAGRRRRDPGSDTWWPTPEPPHRINQLYMEPLLHDHAAGRPGLQLVNDVEIETVSQDADGVAAGGLRSDGSRLVARGAYLVGCDGGRSMVRRSLGFEMLGDAVVQRVQSTLIDAPGLGERMASEAAWATIVLNERRSGTAYAIDGERRWLVHNYLRPDEADFDSVDRDWALRTIIGDHDVHYDVVSIENWVGRRLVSQGFRNQRIFLCGDSAHIWVPYAGYGMNAGVADAMGLAWPLAAVLNGWAAPGLLDCYEAERYPITEQVSRHAMAHAERMIRNREGIPPDLEDDTEAGAATRVRYGRAMEELNIAQYCCAGLNFGYFYDESPIIVADGVAPPYSMGSFEPSTVPGCRMPHVEMADGSALYDGLGHGYTVVGTAEALAVARADLFEAAALARSVPIGCIPVVPGAVAELPAHQVVIVRPDAHIAWRGTDLSSPEPLLDVLCGAG